MLTTKRYEYLNTDSIGIHPTIGNHRTVNQAKIDHLVKDIVVNGLLEPLVVWERNQNEFYLVGGFHRHEAIRRIRVQNPGYFDRVDVRVVAGEPDEIKALNLKLNADRLDTRITDYFETVLYLNNVNWSPERIAEFLDKSTGWIEEIIRFAPSVNSEMKAKLEAGELSWNRAREIIQRMLDAPAGQEKAVLGEELAKQQTRAIRPMTFKSAISHFDKVLESSPKKSWSLQADDLLSLLLVLQGKKFEKVHLKRVQRIFPELLQN